MANKQRYYPQVKDVESANVAIHQLHDHVYDLRSQLDEHKATIDKMQKEKATLNSGVNTQIGGLNVSGSPTANGQKLVWNAGTGQLEWQ
jgi:hypothetical protein